jgi:hypothetical protein
LGSDVVAATRNLTIRRTFLQSFSEFSEIEEAESEKAKSFHRRQIFFMPLYRYYVSASPGDPSPADGGLLSVEADSPASAVAKLRDEGQLPDNWESLWIHILVWVDQEGQQRGFESISLRSFADG